VFFAKAIRSRGLAPETITPDGFAASHRVAREMKVGGLLPEEITLKSHRCLKNRIGRNHRNVNSRVDVMLGFKRFRDSTVTISGIELMHRIRQGPLGLTDVRLTHTSAPVIWIAERSVC
jgi:transposase-like protein